MMNESILEKWKDLILACKNYYVDGVPTGILDSEFDELERRALEEDNFSARDYVFETYLKGTRTKNQYIQKFKKTKVNGSMFAALESVSSETSYYDLKYDGTSIAIYLDPDTGIPRRAVTTGNLNIDNFGIDQTDKILKLLPHHFMKGIVAIQAEGLIDLENLPEGLNPEKARQKANALICSKYKDDEVSKYLTLRAYRYYTSDTTEGYAVSKMDYKRVIETFETVRSPKDNHITFAPADVYEIEDLRKNPKACECDRVKTSTGTFLIDGWVRYDNTGLCLGALKFAGAGSGSEAIKTTVKSIIWNDQTPKGKDSWSANVLIDPVTIKGATIHKPSAGSVKKLVNNKISKGAEVGIILANSTIPAVGTVFSPGNEDYEWPICGCGYKMSEKDIYGSYLKCGNLMCSQRMGRMKNYLSSLTSPNDIDLNKFLVIDRFKWEDTSIDISKLISCVLVSNSSGYYEYLKSFLTTDLQKRNLDLVWKASWIVLCEYYESIYNDHA